MTDQPGTAPQEPPPRPDDRAGNGSSAPPAPPAAPPTVRGALRGPPRQPVWPPVLGTIGVVMGALGVLAGLNNLATPLWIAITSRVSPAGMPTGEHAMREFGWMLILGGVAALILGTLLIVGGTGLIRRRTWGLRVVITWALLKIPYVFVSAVLQAQVQLAQRDQMQTFFSNMPRTGGGPGRGGGPPVGLMTSFMDIAASLGVIFSLLWGLILPILMLCILSQRSIRAQARAWPAPEKRSRTKASPHVSTAPPPV